MRIPKVTELVREQATFVKFEDSNLWYQIIYSYDETVLDECGPSYTRKVPALFDFPVPISDAGGATFLNVDKGIFFMRWIRKHVEMLTGAQAE